MLTRLEMWCIWSMIFQICSSSHLCNNRLMSKWINAKVKWSLTVNFINLDNRCWGRSPCRPVLTLTNIPHLKAKITLIEVATVITIWTITTSCCNQNLLTIQLLVTTRALRRVSLILSALLEHNSLSLNVYLITKKWTWPGAKWSAKYHARIWEP